MINTIHNTVLWVISRQITSYPPTPWRFPQCSHSSTVNIWGTTWKHKPIYVCNTQVAVIPNFILRRHNRSKISCFQQKVKWHDFVREQIILAVVMVMLSFWRCTVCCHSDKKPCGSKVWMTFFMHSRRFWSVCHEIWWFRKCGQQTKYICHRVFMWDLACICAGQFGSEYKSNYRFTNLNTVTVT